VIDQFGHNTIRSVNYSFLVSRFYDERIKFSVLLLNNNVETSYLAYLSDYISNQSLFHCLTLSWTTTDMID